MLPKWVVRGLEPLATSVVILKRVISRISLDRRANIAHLPKGGLEFMSRASTISEPFFNYRPSTLPAHLPSVQIMSVDILPSSLPLDASTHFCRVLMPYLKAVIQEYRGQPVEQEYSDALKAATVTKDGQLQGAHTCLEAPLDKWRRSAAKLEGSPRKNKVLVLGSGMVAGPAVQELGKRSDIELVVGQ